MCQTALQERHRQATTDFLLTICTSVDPQMGQDVHFSVGISQETANLAPWPLLAEQLSRCKAHQVAV